MALYGAPIWCHRFSGVRRCRAKLCSLQRRIAIRIARGYRTISYETATLLARFPPLDILVNMDARIYIRTHVHRQGGENELPSAIRRQERNRAFATWRVRLREERYVRKRVVEAILPVFETWMRRRRKVTYRLTQILTGHGCFREFLYKIGRETTATCHHCGRDQDTAQHTLEACPSWAAERQVLIEEIGENLSLPAVVSAMLDRDSAWRAVVSFCENVMVQKEAAERDRERADPTRRARR